MIMNQSGHAQHFLRNMLHPLETPNTRLLMSSSAPLMTPASHIHDFLPEKLPE